MTKENLRDLFVELKNIPGWLSGLDLPASDLEYIETLADGYQRDMRTLKAAWEKQNRERPPEERPDWLPRVNNKNSVTQSEIMRAAQFPLDKIVEVVRGRVPCLWTEHEGKYPSMMYKNGFVHCFKCNTTKSTISYFMRLKGLAFSEAVKAMQ